MSVVLRYVPKGATTEVVFTIPIQPDQFTLQRRIMRTDDTRSVGGVVSRKLKSAFDLIAFSFGPLPDPDSLIFDGLFAWWSHAATGRVFHMEFRDDNVLVPAVSGKLDEALAAGGNTLSLDFPSLEGSVLTDSKTRYRLTAVAGHTELITLSGPGFGQGDFVIGGAITETLFPYVMGDVFSDDSDTLEILLNMIVPDNRQPFKRTIHGTAIKANIIARSTGGEDVPGGLA